MEEFANVCQLFRYVLDPNPEFKRQLAIELAFLEKNANKFWALSIQI